MFYFDSENNNSVLLRKEGGTFEISELYHVLPESNLKSPPILIQAMSPSNKMNLKYL